MFLANSFHNDEQIIQLDINMVTNMNPKYLILSLLCLTVNANADSSTMDAAIGGGIGGAAGAAIGNEVGGRDGAIVGGAIGAAIGTVVTTDEKNNKPLPPPNVEIEYSPSGGGHSKQYHCPPGQRKKGRC